MLRARDEFLCSLDIGVETNTLTRGGGGPTLGLTLHHIFSALQGPQLHEPFCHLLFVTKSTQTAQTTKPTKTTKTTETTETITEISTQTATQLIPQTVLVLR